MSRKPSFEKLELKGKEPEKEAVMLKRAEEAL